MDHFTEFRSNTAAAGGNQYLFCSSFDQIYKGRVFYRVTCGGTFAYRICYTNTIDSTFADGSITKCNIPCERWEILSCRIGKCKADSIGPDFASQDASAKVNRKVIFESNLTFSGKASAVISDGSFYWSDPVTIHCSAGDYLCVETEFHGTLMPYHEESLLPIFRETDGRWCFDKRVPLPGILACNRPVKARIGFWGDSITQGIGTVPNSYSHWCALAAQKLGESYACWNLGLGYARASDAASNGAWMKKALHNDVLCICFGVNDILQGKTVNKIKQDLLTIVSILKQHNKTVLLQTIPPFDYSDAHTKTWQEVNRYIREELSRIVDGIFDNVPILARSSAEPHRANFGGHPNETGCALWADALVPALKKLL